jgi:hypothetical protein
VHGEEVDKAYAAVQRFVFEIMPDKRRRFHHLIQRRGIKYDECQDNISYKSLHSHNLEFTTCINKEKRISIHLPSYITLIVIIF